MVEELNKLVKNCKNVHHLNEPIVLEDATYPPNNVVLKPLQLTRIPTVRYRNYVGLLNSFYIITL